MSATELAKGNYSLIYGVIFPDVKQQHTKHQPCPVCGGKDRFRLYADWQETGGAICNQCEAGNGFTWIMRALGCNFREAYSRVEQILGVDRNDPDIAQMLASLKKRQAEQEAIRQSRIEAEKPYKHHQLISVLRQAKPIQEVGAALLYLHHRGLGELIERNDWPQWGAVDALQYQDDNTKATYPALVAPVVLKDQLVNVHRTFITMEGNKAPVESPKKLMPSLYPGAMNGAAIQLYPAGSTLALAEGIETALAIRIAQPDLPVWATVSANGLQSVRLPGQVCKVFIMADLDASQAGEKAAYALQQRLRKEGREALVCLPDAPIPAGAKGIDWLDVLNSQEVAA